MEPSAPQSKRIMPSYSCEARAGVEHCAVQICTDYLSACDKALAKADMKLVDRQLACMPIQSPEGQAYLGAMAAAANFAFANRSLIMKEVRQAFEKTFGKTAHQVSALSAVACWLPASWASNHVLTTQGVQWILHSCSRHPLCKSFVHSTPTPLLARCCWLWRGCQGTNALPLFPLLGGGEAMSARQLRHSPAAPHSW